jgi:hypothetical protein
MTDRIWNAWNIYNLQRIKRPRRVQSGGDRLDRYGLEAAGVLAASNKQAKVIRGFCQGPNRESEQIPETLQRSARRQKRIVPGIKFSKALRKAWLHIQFPNHVL